MAIDGAGHGGHGGHSSDIGHSGGLNSHDLDLGHSHGHSHGGKGKSHSSHHHGGHNHDGKVTVEALMHAHSFSGAPAFSDFGHVDATVDHSGLPDHGHVGGEFSGDGVDHKKGFAKRNEAFLRAVEAAKKDPLRRSYGVHVVSHGFCNLPRTFTELATKLGAVRVCGTTGNFYPTDVSLNELTDWTKFAPPYSRRRPPAGWYANAMGLTHIWRQYWQVPPKTIRLFKPKGRPLFDRAQSTYIEVQMVTWFYASIGDYETRIDINVVSLPVLDQYDKRWAIRATPLKNHQRVAEGLSDGLFEALKFAQPTEWARERRKKLIVFQTTKPAEVEKSGADLDTLFLSLPPHMKQFPGDVQTFAAVRKTVEADGAEPAANPSTPPAPTGKQVTVDVAIPPAKQR